MGYNSDSFDDKIQPVEALQNLACLIESTIAVWTSTHGYPDHKFVDKSSLKIWEVGGMYLKKMNNVDYEMI